MALKTFWTKELAIYEDERDAAQKDLAAAQASQKDAKVQLAADLKRLDQVTGDIAAMRAKLAVISSADADALIVEITGKIIKQRGLQGTVLDDQDALDAATANADAADTTLKRATARIASVKATIAQVEAEDAQREALRKAVEPLAVLRLLPENAKTFSIAGATTRIEGNLPKEILTIAGLRHDTRRNRLTSLQTVLDKAQEELGTELATNGGLRGVVIEKQIALQRAQSVLSHYVATAGHRFAKAQAVMTMLEEIQVTDVLTQAEKDQLTALAAAGAAVEPDEEPEDEPDEEPDEEPGEEPDDQSAEKPTAMAIDTKLNAVFNAQDELDAAILLQIKDNVDELSTAQAVKDKRTAIDDATKIYTQAIEDFINADPPNKESLDQWEAVIPDAAWKVLLEYLEAMTALDELSQADPEQMANDMDDAENAYTDALAAAEMARRHADAYSDAIALRAQRLALAQAAITNRLPSAIRGDIY